MGAGLSFAKCHFEARVPNDPFLMGVFDGEEFSRMVRAWTHGYDSYAPQRAVVFHDYGNPRFKTGAWSSHGSSYGRERISLLMKGVKESVASQEPIKNPTTDLGIYGLGTARTLTQFESFSGIPVTSGGSGAADLGKCASLAYVNYKPEPGPSSRPPPAPPADTYIPRNVVKGSDTSQWPNPAQLTAELSTGAQQFVLAEVGSGESSDQRAVPFERLLKELGSPLPPYRSVAEAAQDISHEGLRGRLIRQHKLLS
eukprot:TRINITY_DN23501_c0_g1_i3.p1 TRINITY_DN23501_c0_g1~~TRINITY_DN23501_c0_g1_i3.p1  ORF type:complete len:255 (-),score=27.01 TRINITY_DN23501_c0_g1_i3:40-804(-)